ncbi:succinate dehydrogenase cytochrome b560 subunit, mitochondrial-like [Hyposmocoma kahamanoa]|uniref:succinate dehydrogenase cytochrome b560 subunit, mitochondrial-like n=1 Tax=Hyposmocoma kahamanoa TaxID=1477025 RepID=UPI000E6D8A6A|nr:succinate dehydrogenase cytochrome b560 subunit, mitochondrial-like [Hyposmocoma kahamanoa]
MYNECGTTQGGSKHKIIYKPYTKPCYMDHDHKNMTLKRPMSPHLTIYGPTLPAMTSITQRITGTIVTFYAVMMAGGALFMPCGIDSYVALIQSLNLPDALVIIIKFFLGLPFSYHYFIGIRYVLFNMAKFMVLKEAYQSAYIALVTSVATSAAFAVLF